MTKYEALTIMALKLINQYSVGYSKLDEDTFKSLIRSIDTVTQEDWEAETLLRIAYWESRFKKEVVNCTIVGKSGDRGAFQIIPISYSQQLDACSSNYEIQSKLALSRIRESRKVCESKGFRGSDVIGLYTTGKCKSGDSAARLRFGDGTKLRLLINEK